MFPHFIIIINNAIVTFLYIYVALYVKVSPGHALLSKTATT